MSADAINTSDDARAGNKRDDVELETIDKCDDEIQSQQSHKVGFVSKMWRQTRPSAIFPGSEPPELLQWLMVIVAIIIGFGAIVSLLGEPAMPFNGPIFQLLLLFLLAVINGKLVAFVRLPPLLGMLLTGITLRNLGIFHIHEDSQNFYLQVMANLRLCAMVVILLKAGLGLDPQALRKLSCVVLRLAFCPCIVEAVTAMCAAHLFLRMPWIWGTLLGFVLAAVSPAVVVPSLLGLKERGYGEDKGISTLVIAASSLDDILAISAFGIFLGIIFSEGSLTQQIIQGPLEIVIGLGFGLLFGLLVMYIPHRKDNEVVAWRSAFVGLGGILAIFGSQKIGFDGAGPLGCILAAFVAACGWKAEESGATIPVEKVYSFLWQIFQPILFGLIGTEIKISELDSSTVLLGLCVLFCGLLMRIITVGLITIGGTLTLKERFFVAIAWLPKATVQAALAPVALDIARQTGASEEVIEFAEQVLTIAVLSILVTAPIGAIGINISGPRLLTQWLDAGESQDDKTIQAEGQCHVIRFLKRPKK